MATSMLFCRLPSSLTSISRGITHLYASTIHKAHARALIYVLPITITRNIFTKHADERFVTCEDAKVMRFQTCQTVSVTRSVRASDSRVWATPAGGSSVNPVVSTQSEHGSGQGNRGNNNHKCHRSGRIIFPTSLLAIPFFSKKDDEMAEAIKKLKDVDELELFLRRAKLAEHKGEWHDAAEFYHQALALLNIRKQQTIWDEPRVLQAQIYIYDNMANLAMSRGRLDEAEILYKETVKGLVGSGRAKDDNAIVEISLKLAMIYAMQQRTKESEAGYKFCMSTMEEKMTDAGPVDGDTVALYGMCINSFSRFLIIHNRLREADAALRKTIDVAVRALSKAHAQVAVLYSDLATVASMLGNQEAAKQHIEKAIAIAEDVESPDIATFLCNKGLICVESGECEEAAGCCRRALRIAKKSNDKEAEAEAELCLKDVKEKLKKL